MCVAADEICTFILNAASVQKPPSFVEEYFVFRFAKLVFALQLQTPVNPFLIRCNLNTIVVFSLH